MVDEKKPDAPVVKALNEKEQSPASIAQLPATAEGAELIRQNLPFRWYMSYQAEFGQIFFELQDHWLIAPGCLAGGIVTSRPTASR